jgi:histone H3/H4
MPRPGSTIPKEPVSRLMQKGGAKRVADDAASEMVEHLTSYALRIGKKAVEIARHTGRKTVQAEDIRIAAK